MDRQLKHPALAHVLKRILEVNMPSLTTAGQMRLPESSHAASERSMSVTSEIQAKLQERVRI